MWSRNNDSENGKIHSVDNVFLIAIAIVIMKIIMICIQAVMTHDDNDGGYNDAYHYRHYYYQQC